MIETHNIDCFNHLAAMADNSVDAVISDPPYGTTALEFDQIKIDWERWWKEILRVTKPGANIVLFGAQPFTTAMINAQPRYFRYQLIWHKPMAVGFLDAKARPLRAHEDIMLFCTQGATGSNKNRPTYNPQRTPRARVAVKRNKAASKAAHYGVTRGLDGTSVYSEGRLPRSVLTFANNTGPKDYPFPSHPTAKPVDLMRWLVATYTNAGDLVLDPFMGGGATGVACAQLERSFIGCELDKIYHDLAAWRIGRADKELPTGRDWGALSDCSPSLPQTPRDAEEAARRRRKVTPDE